MLMKHSRCDLGSGPTKAHPCGLVETLGGRGGQLIALSRLKRTIQEVHNTVYGILKKPKAKRRADNGKRAKKAQSAKKSCTTGK
ncbi:hypothetical protein KIN20_030240 [Parelaphostrongylus tenuis]|uniref:Uncharacterized protein n=1 Tax=Parelaphostrongylus tenuis TaxID=148309 RepID=A0AAD5WG74_PARTN|nr:hypothetical protein KIN20_030240 [Parelaphostrongylus tenuis]